MIAAVVLAAGRSQRMGRPKMTLPWGDTTVIGRVVQVLIAAGVEQIVVVTGGSHQEVETALEGQPVRVVINPNFSSGEMTASLQVGLECLPGDCQAALVALGDQPQIIPEVVTALLEHWRLAHSAICVPSFQMRRGHPWLVERSLWPELMNLGAEQSLRDFLAAHADRIDYLVVETDSILMDLDTPDDYQRHKPDAPSLA